MKLQDKMKVTFTNVSWDTVSGDVPSEFFLNIPCKFFCEPAAKGSDEAAMIYGHDDLHDIFAAYLYDEMGYAPLKFDFKLEAFSTSA